MSRNYYGLEKKKLLWTTKNGDKLLQLLECRFAWVPMPESQPSIALVLATLLGKLPQRAPSPVFEDPTLNHIRDAYIILGHIP